MFKFDEATHKLKMHEWSKQTCAHGSKSSEVLYNYLTHHLIPGNYQISFFFGGGELYFRGCFAHTFLYD